MDMNTVNDATDAAIFEKLWDVAVVGAGYAGYAAATAASQAGLSTLLVDPGCSLLRESSVCRFAEVGAAPSGMRPFLHAVENATGIADDWIDPGSAEWIANELLAETSVRILYFATPVAACATPGNRLQSVTFALRDRLRAVRASHWIDASESGILARICGSGVPPARPARLVTNLFLQRIRWHVKCPLGIMTGIRGVRARLEDSRWSSEKILRIETSGRGPDVGADLVSRLFGKLHSQIGADAGGSILSHWSFAPYPLYPRRGVAQPSPCSNLALAIPAFSDMPSATLGDRFAIGLEALAAVQSGTRVRHAGVAAPAKPGNPVPTRKIAADVCVVGLGASGLLAAVAAARAGARVVAIEAAVAPGGTATVGGVANYYHGLSGGLQDELDAEMVRLSDRISPDRPKHGPYCPFARIAISRSMLSSAGVKTLEESSFIPGSAVCSGGNILSILAATPEGVACISAKSWIDATGEAFLARSAGVPSGAGRPGDNLMNPFGQIWGAFGFTAPDRLGLFIFTPDSGFVDPSDSVALTKARVSAVRKLVDGSCVRTSNTFNRTTGVFPMPGIRRGPLVRTRYELSLDDLVERRCFPDAIGFTGGHVDSHMRDAFAESPELCFFLWCAGLWGAQTACEIPYRALLPVGVENLWVPCRAGGVDANTAYALRMQRDMQRKGEASGIAAAMAAMARCGSSDVPLGELQAALRRSGALRPWRRRTPPFGERSIASYAGDPAFTGPATPAAIADWVGALGGPNGGMALWRLFRASRAEVAPLLRPLLSADGAGGDRAALLLGAIGDSAATPRLEKAAVSRTASDASFAIVPLATASIWALGFCGGASSFGLLAGIACDTGRDALSRLAALWSAGTIARRIGIPATARGIVGELRKGTADLENAMDPPRPGHLEAALARITSLREVRPNG